MATVKIKRNSWNAIDKNGEFQFPRPIRCAWLSHFVQGFAIARINNTEYAIIDQRGNFLSNKKFRFVSFFQNGLAAVQFTDASWNFIDQRGNFLSHENFNLVDDFHTQSAIVQTKNYQIKYLTRDGCLLSSIDELIDFILFKPELFNLLT